MHRKTPELPCHVRVTSTDVHTSYAPEAQLLSVSLYDQRFSSYGANFKKRALNDPPNDLGKSTHRHTTYTPKAQIFISFAL